MDRHELETVLGLLESRYGKGLKTQLHHRNTTELFVAVLLSPQCADAQVNKVTPALFRRYRTMQDYADADLRELMRYVKGINYYKTKARNLRSAAQRIVRDFSGKVPRNMEDLMSLQGVGRKVANVILTEGYGISEGIAIDTHCITVSRRLKLLRSSDPARIEGYLMKRLPRSRWRAVSNLFIELGRDTCTARRKFCGECVLKRICPSSDAGVAT